MPNESSVYTPYIYSKENARKLARIAQASASQYLMTVLSQTLREHVKMHGYGILQNIELSQAADLIRQFGEITVDRRNPEPFRSNSPQSPENARPNTLSSQHGLGKFPFHTDAAHWNRPPEFVFLFCKNPGNGNRPTELIDTRQWQITPMLRHALRSDLWKTGFRSPRFCTVVTEVDGEQNWRYDVGCMRPSGKKSTALKAEIETLITATEPARLFWTEAVLLVLDNKRMLHARGHAIAPDQDRKLIRILVGGLQ